MDDGDSCDSDINNKCVKDRAYLDNRWVVSFCAFFNKRYNMYNVILFLIALLFLSNASTDIYKPYIGNGVSIVDNAINKSYNNTRTKCLDYVPIARIVVVQAIVAFIAVMLDSIIVYNSIYYGYPVGANAPPNVFIKKKVKA